jgi:serine protease Do
MKKMKLRTAFISLTVVLILILSMLSGCITITSPDSTTTTPAATTPVVTSNPINPEWTPPVISGDNEELPSIADVVALVKPSVVAITTEVIMRDFFNRQFTQEGAGSGWILDESGIIVTNNHVIEGASSITVTTEDGTNYEADIDSVATDALNDLAILKIDAEGLPALKRGNASELRVGDWVIAIGNALGQGIRATEGIVSRKNVSLQFDQGDTLYDLLETSAAINPGNSGGPLVNLAGEVIGITSAKIAQVGVEGMGYAISIDTAFPIIEELVTTGYVVRPYLGVSLYTVDQIAISQLNLSVDTGVVILEIVDNAPADQAGLQAGDVIVRIDGEDVATVREFTDVLYASEIGEPIEITYWRGDVQNTVTVISSASPVPVM